MTLRMIAALALALLATSSQAFGAYVTVLGIHPPQPRAFELVTLRYRADGCRPGGRARVERVGSDFVVTMLKDRLYILCPATAPDSPYDVEARIGSFPPGSYHVDIVAEPSGEIIPIVDPKRIYFTVGASPPLPATDPSAQRPLSDFSGHWWVPSESGWGLSIHQSATDPMFVVFYHYDASGRAVWFVAPGGRWSSNWDWKATLYRTTGPHFAGTPFDPARVERTAVGSAELQFRVYPSGYVVTYPSRFGQARFSYDIDGIRVTKVIERLPF